MCVCELAPILGITQPSISRHLKKLKSTGLIGDEQSGLWTNYYLRMPEEFYAGTLLAQLHSWLNDDPVIQGDLEKLEKIDKTKRCCG